MPDATAPRARWKTPALIALVAANAAMAASLFAPWLPGVPDAAPASAQAADPEIAAMMQPAGEYLMIPATLTSANQDILYIIDTRSGNLTAAAFERQGGIEFIPPLPLSQFFQRAGQGR